MRLVVVGLLAACSSAKDAEPPPPPTKLQLPPSAFELHSHEEPAGLRDSRTVTTFCLPKDRDGELDRLPCRPAPGASCTHRKLHTEVTVTVEERRQELFVTIVESEYDNCLFEGCPQHRP